MKRLLAVVGGAIVIIALAAFSYWELRLRVERIDSAWVIEDAGKPYVVMIERKSASEDYRLLRTLEVDSGAVVARTNIGTSRERVKPEIAGPAGGRYAWVHTKTRGLELVDLITHVARVAATDVTLRQPLGPWIDQEGRAYVIDPRNQGVLFDTTLKQTPAATPPAGRDARCAPATRAAKGLFNADSRGCIGDKAFVQHSAAAARADWLASLVAPDGKLLWTTPASALGGDSSAWFAHAVGSGDSLRVVLVQPGDLTADVRYVELDAGSGAVRKNTSL